MELEPTEVAWAAGFFDGEGHARFDVRGRLHNVRLQVSQKRTEPLERFRDAVGGLGSIYRDARSDGSRVMYSWQVGNWRDVQAVAAMMWGFLCEPKRAQLRPVLAHIPEMTLRPPRSRSDMRTTCSRGHVRTTTQADGRPVCAQCRRDKRFCRSCIDCGSPITRRAVRCTSCENRHSGRIDAALAALGRSRRAIDQTELADAVKLL